MINKFLTEHKQLSRELNSRKIEGPRRAQIVSMFCSEFLHTYTYNPKTGFLCGVDARKSDKIDYFRDILQFCLSTDVCSRLNISPVDLMNLDLASYRMLRDELKSHPKQEAQDIKKLLDSTQV